MIHPDSDLPCCLTRLLDPFPCRVFWFCVSRLSQRDPIAIMILIAILSPPPWTEDCRSRQAYRAEKAGSRSASDMLGRQEGSRANRLPRTLATTFRIVRPCHEKTCAHLRRGTGSRAFATISSALHSRNGRPQSRTKFPIALDVPFAAHRSALALATLGIEQNPCPPPGRLRARAGIVFVQTPIQIGGPADIGPAIVFSPAAQNVNEERHANWRSREDSNL